MARRGARGRYDGECILPACPSCRRRVVKAAVTCPACGQLTELGLKRQADAAPAQMTARANQLRQGRERATNHVADSLKAIRDRFGYVNIGRDGLQVPVLPQKTRVTRLVQLDRCIGGAAERVSPAKRCGGLEREAHAKRGF